jgi:glycosyltransferase involved in cell wall biosynthesis
VKNKIHKLIDEYLKEGKSKVDNIQINYLDIENNTFLSLNDSAHIILNLSQPTNSIRFSLQIHDNSDNPEGLMKLSYKNNTSNFDDLHTVLLSKANGKYIIRNLKFPFPVDCLKIDFIDFTDFFSIQTFCINPYPNILFKFHNFYDLLTVIFNPKTFSEYFDLLKNKNFQELKDKLYTEKENKKLKYLGLYNPPLGVYHKPIFSNSIKEKILNFKTKPLFSIVMPVYNTPEKYLIKAINSIKKQWYTNWELCLVDDASNNPKTLKVINNLQNLNNSKKFLNKFKIKILKNNVNISNASNIALNMAKGDFIVLIDHDDELTPDALYEVALTLNQNEYDFIYSDEDKLDMNEMYIDHHFKPDYSPDMLLSTNYISHLAVIRKELLKDIGGWSEGVEGAQDYDVYLKIVEKTKKIKHIPKILYHWRKIPGSTASNFDDKSYAATAGIKALTAALKRRQLNAEVIPGKSPGNYKINYKIKGQPLVSIIIPFRDQTEYLQKCINSIIIKSTYTNYEIIAINNNSTEKSTFSTIKKLAKQDFRIKFFDYNKPFNYSAINNFAVSKFATGEHIVLMNNDIEIITKNWIEELLMYSQRENTACIGAKLYFPDNTIQHAGVILGLGQYASHAHRFFPKDSQGYANRLINVHNLSAVTAALMMIKRKLYLSIGGLDEEYFKIAYNDVDFCLKLLKKGYLNVFNPYCEAYHHESISRGNDDQDPEKIQRFEEEKRNLLDIHGKFIKIGDPYYNPNLTTAREDFSLR